MSFKNLHIILANASIKFKIIKNIFFILYMALLQKPKHLYNLKLFLINNHYYLKINSIIVACLSLK